MRFLPSSTALRHAILMTGLAGLILLGQPPAARAAILARGLVTTADGTPVKGAEIALNGWWTGVMTGADGRFAFPSLKAGALRVGVRHERFAPLEQAFSLHEGDSPSWTFVLVERGPEPLRDLPRMRELLHTELQGAFKQAVEQREFPQSASIVTRDALRDRAAFDLREAARGVAGVVALPDDGSGTADFVFRGQSMLGASGTVRDGDREPAGVPRDLSGIERVEFLRGHGSLLEGRSGLWGGSAITVAKRPHLESSGEARVAADSWGRVRTTIDQGATFGTSRATYRVNAAHDRLLGFREGTRSGQGVALSPVFDVPLGELTHLLVRGEYVHRAFSDDPGLPLAAASLSVPVDRFVGEPGDDVIAEGGAAQLELTHFLEGDLQLRQSLRYLAGSTRGRRVQVTGLTGTGLVTRQSLGSSARTQAFASQSELLAQVHMGRFEHALVTGFEYTNAASAGESSLDSLASVSLAAPVQGAQPVALGARQGYRAPSHTMAVYAQDHLRLHARLRLLLSGRWQQHTLERTGALDAGSLTGVTQSTFGSTARATTGRAGLVFQPMRRGRVFVLAGHAFEPSAALVERGDPPGLLRTTGTQYELGWKQESASGRFAWSASTYSLTQRHVRALRPLAANGSYSWRIGEQQSTGFEFDAAGAIGNDLRVTLGYAYTDARITDPGETNAVDGTRLPMAPRHHSSVWAVYRVPAGALAGLDLGAGLVSQSERSSALVGGPVLPRLNELDVMLGYGRQRWQAQLDVRNATDERAFDGVPGDHLVPREPRSVRGSLLVRF